MLNIYRKTQSYNNEEKREESENRKKGVIEREKEREREMWLACHNMTNC